MREKFIAKMAVEERRRFEAWVEWCRDAKEQHRAAVKEREKERRGRSSTLERSSFTRSSGPKPDATHQAGAPVSCPKCGAGERLGAALSEHKRRPMHGRKKYAHEQRAWA